MGRIKLSENFYFESILTDMTVSRHRYIWVEQIKKQIRINYKIGNHVDIMLNKQIGIWTYSINYILLYLRYSKISILYDTISIIKLQ